MLKKVLIKGYQAGHGFFAEKKTRPKLLLILNGVLVKLLKSNFVELDGHKIFLDDRDSLRLSTRGPYEPYLQELMRKKVKKGDVVVDVGANIGYHTLFLARLVGEKGKVYAFEPHPENFALLKKNVEANGYKNVVLEQKAVTDKAVRVKLHLDKNETTLMHSILKNDYTVEQSIEVDSVTLDEYFKDTKLDFIKMDIEGAEHYALLGMRKILQKNKQIKLLTEFTPVHLEKLGVKPEEHLQLLRTFGFNLCNINEKNKVLETFELEKMPLYVTTRFGGSVNSINTNLFCYKE